MLCKGSRKLAAKSREPAGLEEPRKRLHSWMGHPPRWLQVQKEIRPGSLTLGRLHASGTPLHPRTDPFNPSKRVASETRDGNIANLRESGGFQMASDHGPQSSRMDGLEWKWFIWEVVPPQMSREWGSETGKGRQSTKRVFSTSIGELC